MFHIVADLWTEIARPAVPPAVTSVRCVRRLLEAPHLDCKHWGTARSVDATLETSHLASIVLEISGMSQQRH
jgi:hypothetical protein